MDRLDVYLVKNGYVRTRSQAQSFISLGRVYVNNQSARKSGLNIGKNDKVKVDTSEVYVSRAGYKLASVAEQLKLNFKDKVVLDVGSSTGGFTDYAMQHGAKKVIAVDVGTDQLHPSLRINEKIELHEKTDIRTFPKPKENIDITLIDVSFISLREVIPSIVKLTNGNIVAMVKPQFEAGDKSKHKGVIKNERMRRDILKEFERWVIKFCAVINKADSQVEGEKGNRERFYLLKSLS